jgi:hypothetical protein
MSLNLSILGWPPFAALRALPGFDELRSPFRFAIIMQVLLAALATLALSYLLTSLRQRWWRGGAA